MNKLLQYSPVYCPPDNIGLFYGAQLQTASGKCCRAATWAALTAGQQSAVINLIVIVIYNYCFFFVFFNQCCFKMPTVHYDLGFTWSSSWARSENQMWMNFLQDKTSSSAFHRSLLQKMYAVRCFSVVELSQNSSNKNEWQETTAPPEFILN